MRDSVHARSNRLTAKIFPFSFPSPFRFSLSLSPHHPLLLTSMECCGGIDMAYLGCLSNSHDLAHPRCAESIHCSWRPRENPRILFGRTDRTSRSTGLLGSTSVHRRSMRGNGSSGRAFASTETSLVRHTNRQSISPSPSISSVFPLSISPPPSLPLRLLHLLHLLHLLQLSSSPQPSHTSPPGVPRHRPP